MSSNNTYVINLNQDEKRMKFFEQISKNLTFQRFSAHKWEQHYMDNNHHQDAMAARYPYIRYAAKRGLYGDAGCTLSHVSLLQYFLDDSQKEESDCVHL